MYKKKKLNFKVVFALCFSLLICFSTNIISDVYASATGSNYQILHYDRSNLNAIYDKNEDILFFEVFEPSEKSLNFVLPDRVFTGAGEENAIVFTFSFRNLTGENLTVGLNEKSYKSMVGADNVDVSLTEKLNGQDFFYKTIADGDGFYVELKYVMKDTSQDINLEVLVLFDLSQG